jgi:bifunctional non-homologous end joining protein LigD
MTLPLPAYRPQLATLVEVPPEGDGFLHELKLDGYRMGCSLESGKVRLETRRGNDWTVSFPSVAAVARGLAAKSALLDGEVAALMPSGVTNFSALHDVAAAGGKLVYFVFDLLHWDGEDIAALPLLERKARLQELLAASASGETFRYVDHVIGDGARALAHACKLGGEGIVSKNIRAAYRPGRNSAWLKAKCVQRQELVIAGFTDPEGSRAGIGALLVAYYEASGELRYAGKVGTGKGFTREFLIGLRAQLNELERNECPFALRPKGIKVSATHWVQPQLVVEVQFAEWTADGHLRHPSLVGIRKDKRASEVVREMPK